MSEGRQKEFEDGPQRWTETDAKDARRLLAELNARKKRPSGERPEQIQGKPSRRETAAAQGTQFQMEFSRVSSPPPAETRGEASAKRSSLPTETCRQTGGVERQQDR